jgi:hypothetical protein
MIVFSDHDELRYSLRSAIQYFRPHIGTLHIIAGDFKPPKGYDELIIQRMPRSINRSETEEVPTSTAIYPASNAPVQVATLAPHRLGQIPQWLDADPSSTHWVSNENARIEFHHHAQLFEKYTGPSFNSFAIESQMARLDGVEEHL